MFKIVFVIIGLLLVSGCVNVATPNPASSPTDFGHGVYYFKAGPTIDFFGKSLSQFRAGNPNLSVVSVVGDAGGINGQNLGFYVTFENVNQTCRCR